MQRTEPELERSETEQLRECEKKEERLALNTGAPQVALARP